MARKEPLDLEAIERLVAEGRGDEEWQFSARIPLKLHLLLQRERDRTGKSLKRIVGDRLLESYRNEQ